MESRGVRAHAASGPGGVAGEYQEEWTCHLCAARPFRHARWAVVIRTTLPATGQLVWQCGDHTVELESAS